MSRHHAGAQAAPALTDLRMAADYQPVAQALAQHWPGVSLEVCDSLDSTNSELMRRARAGQVQPTLLVARQQTAGRGRLGRQWLSGTGLTDADGESASLTFSLGLPLAPASWSGLSLAVGVSIAASLHPDLRLKWPNDLWLHQRKLGGILIETAALDEGRQAIVGVGINLGSRDDTGLARAPAWLEELLPGVDAPQALLRMAAPLLQAIRDFELRGFAPFQPGFAQRDALMGAPLTLSDGTCGVAQGVNAEGALLLRTAEGLQAITSSEVSLRPILEPQAGIPVS
jgi:BirA family biotin operon repressor/biotin-[acetyl-CoA-carboxylase] ligase